MWTSLPEYTSFLKKFKDIKRYYRHYSKNKVKELRKTELDTKAKLKLATVPLHEEFYNMDKQGVANRIKWAMEEIETWKAKGAAIRSRVKWQIVGDRCLAEFLSLFGKRASKP